jgi:hypothetical protein
MATLKKSKKNLVLSGTTTIYKGEFGFSMSVGSKKKDSQEYANFYFNVNFVNDIKEPRAKKGDLIDIEIIDSFIGVYEDKKGNTHPTIVIREYEEL